MDSNTSSLYDTGSTTSASVTAANIAVLLIGLVLYLALVVLAIVTVWKINRKANKPGWAAIIPVYNYVVMLEIVGRPIWWVILSFIPLVNLYISFVVSLDMAKSFGKSTGFGVANFLFPFVTYPLLAFSKNTHYVGPIAEGLDTFAPAPDRVMAAPQVNADGQPIAPQQSATAAPTGQPTPPPFTPPVQQPPQAPADPTQPRPPQS